MEKQQQPLATKLVASRWVCKARFRRWTCHDKGATISRWMRCLNRESRPLRKGGVKPPDHLPLSGIWVLDLADAS